MTEVSRIDMAQAEDLGQAIQQECDNKEVAGYKLVATFTVQQQLILVFQG